MAEHANAITLNVGGTRFETTLEVMTSVPDSMIGKMFGRYDMMLHASDDGSFLINRNCLNFELILEFLRDQNAPRTRRLIRQLCDHDMRMVVEDLAFFGLETAVFDGWLEDAVFIRGPEITSNCRNNCAAVLNGRNVYVIGGYDGEAHSQATTEVLNLDTMVFSKGPAMHSIRSNHAAIRLDANRILVVGGHTTQNCLNTTEILHVDTMRFELGPNLLEARENCSLIALDTHRVLVAGGHGAYELHQGYLSTTEILELDSMQFIPGPTMIHKRSQCGAVALDATRIMVVGKVDTRNTDFPADSNPTEILDLDVMNFTLGPEMSTGRRFSVCGSPVIVPFGVKRFLLVGFCDQFGNGLAQTEVFDLAMMKFEPGPTMQTGRTACAALQLDVHRVLVLGGFWGYDDGCYPGPVQRTELLVIDAEEAKRRQGNVKTLMFSSYPGGVNGAADDGYPDARRDYELWAYSTDDELAREREES